MPDQDFTENITTLKAASKNELIMNLLGIKLEELTPGYARVTMQLKPEHRNANGNLFGGITQALAEQALAYGSNSMANPSVGIQFSIIFMNAAGTNDKLTAECRVLRSGRRNGFSEITVTNQESTLIAKAAGVWVRV